MALTQVQSQMLGGSNPAVPTSVGVGTQALNSNTGANNTAVGYQAGYSQTTAAQVTAIGYKAGYANTASGNCFVGYTAGVGNTSGLGNTFVGGHDASGFAVAQANTTGSANTAIGCGALTTNTGASNQTAIGYQAGFSCSTGNGLNTFVGNQTGYSTNTGAYNTAVGANSLSANTTGYQNSVIGYTALATNVTGFNNTAIGFQALNQSTANNNTAVGYAAGYNNTTGSNNLFLGYYPRSAGSGDAQTMVLSTNSSGAVGKGSNTGFIDANGGGVYQGNNSGSWSTTSDQRLKKNIVDNNTGLDLITQIRVRNFEYRLPEEVDAELSPNDAIQKEGIQLGVIAQEIQQVSEEFVKVESTGVLSVDPDNLTWYLINAVKELNAKVTALETQLAAK